MFPLALILDDILTQLLAIVLKKTLEIVFRKRLTTFMSEVFSKVLPDIDIDEIPWTVFFK